MAIISITITESSDQALAGIPRSVSISTNNHYSIYYTLDNSIPTTNSTIYTSTIFLPTDKLSITLKVLATDGTYSTIVEETYVTNILVDARLPHSATDVPAGTNLPGLYPFGTNPIQPLGIYLSPGEASITVDNPDLTQLPTGYDGDGYLTGFTNEPYNLENYSVVYSTRDAEGQTGIGVGNLPANVKIQDGYPIPEESQQFSNLFNPRAFVIFQDFSKERSEDPPQINREFFSLEDPERIRDGVSYYNSGLDAPPVMGSFVRSHYNPRDNTITYYYLDTHANRWIISKSPYVPTGGFDGNLATVKFGRSRFVYEWQNFARRVLF